MIRHVLLIKFNASASTDDIQAIRGRFELIPAKIQGVESVEWGVNDSLEGKSQGYTHVVLMTFADEDARQRYLPHPEHDALKAVFRPVLDDIVVVDYPV